MRSGFGLFEEGRKRGMFDMEARPCGFRFLHVFWRVGGGMHMVDGVDEAEDVAVRAVDFMLDVFL